MDKRINIIIEQTFLDLLANCKRQGLELDPVMGLSYLPTEKLSEDFKTACHSIIDSLILDSQLKLNVGDSLGPKE